MASPQIENVSDTAFAVANFRAEETARADALFRDPLAGVLAGDHGKKMAAAMPMPYMVSQIVVIRTCVIDDFIRQAISQGVDVIMNLGAGLDTRPYRMDLPESLLWIEVDYPRVIEFKDERLAGQQPRCKLERVPLDLANVPERRKLLAATNARAKKLLILTEGVVSYLSVEEVASLADDLRALDRIEGWIVEYFSSELMNYRGRRRVRWNMQNAPFKFTPPDWFAFFASHGWQSKRIGYLVEEAENLGRPLRLPGIFGAIMKLRAIFISKARRESFRKFQAYVLLEPAKTREENPTSGIKM
ncbi:MAG: SAM-dependent methyltransferase [Candidatus Acidiferrales bacterium]